MRRPELTCGGQVDLLLDYLDQQLPPDLHPQVQGHILNCETCTNLAETYRTTIAIPGAIRELTPAPVGAALTGRLLDRLKAAWASA